MLSKEYLMFFEKWVVDTFNEGKLKSPVHLSGSIDGELEEFLIDLFKNIKPQDWVATTYRSHYHALLKGVPEEKLKNWILDNKSIHFMDKEYKIFSSAIVGGTLPVALGIALGLKMNNQRKKNNSEGSNTSYLDTQSATVGANKQEVKTEVADSHAVGENNGEVVDEGCSPHIFCFVGDTTGHTGIFWEVLKYSNFHDLPITFIIEDNGLSTDTPTEQVWNISNDTYYGLLKHYFKNIVYFRYRRKYPHYGTGKFVSKIWENIDETKQKGF